MSVLFFRNYAYDYWHRGFYEPGTGNWNTSYFCNYLNPTGKFYLIAPPGLASSSQGLQFYSDSRFHYKFDAEEEADIVTVGLYSSYVHDGGHGLTIKIGRDTENVIDAMSNLASASPTGDLISSVTISGSNYNVTYSGDQLLTTSYSSSAWGWHEIQVKRHATQGFIRIWNAGGNVLNLTNIDTLQGRTGLINHVEVFINTSSHHYLRSFYITNNSGHYSERGRLHNVLIQGDYGVLTTGSINEFSGDASYINDNSSGTFRTLPFDEIGKKDLFKLNSGFMNPSTKRCGGINVFHEFIRDAGETGQMHTLFKINDQELTGHQNLPLMSNRMTRTEVTLMKNPVTNEPWTYEELINVEVGYEVANPFGPPTVIPYF